MYAVIESGGKQYRVAPGDVIRVEKLDVQTGDSIHLDRVLLVAGDSGVQVGQPTLANTRVTATVKAHGRGEKIRVFQSAAGASISARPSVTGRISPRSRLPASAANGSDEGSIHGT